jgi:hypothetical protein
MEFLNYNYDDGGNAEILSEKFLVMENYTNGRYTP